MEDTNRTSTGPGTFVITTCFPQLRANGKVPAVPLTTSGSLQLKSPVLFGQFRSGRALSRSDARHQLFSLNFFYLHFGSFFIYFFPLCLGDPLENYRQNKTCARAIWLSGYPDVGLHADPEIRGFDDRCLGCEPRAALALTAVRPNRVCFC